MKNPQKLFRNHKLPVHEHLNADKGPFNDYLRPDDIYPAEAHKILSRLNSFDSAEQLKTAVEKRAREMVLTANDAQNIINSKTERGQFQDLREVATVLRIGAKKFDTIVRALSV